MPGYSDLQVASALPSKDEATKRDYIYQIRFLRPENWSDNLAGLNYGLFIDKRVG